MEVLRRIQLGNFIKSEAVFEKGKKIIKWKNEMQSQKKSIINGNLSDSVEFKIERGT